MIETEIRFRVEDGALEKIRALGAAPIARYFSRDTYLAHPEVTEKTFVMRFREEYGAKNQLAEGKEPNKTLVTLKAASPGGDGSWHEWEEEVISPVNLKAALLAAGFEKKVEILKERSQFKHGEFEINLDEVEKLGKFVEIELKTKEARGLEAVQKLITFAKEKFGVQDTDILHTGYVKLMLDKEA